MSANRASIATVSVPSRAVALARAADSGEGVALPFGGGVDALSWPVPEHRLVFIPGLNGSGPKHWQSLWRARLRKAELVEQADWERPELESWLGGLVTAIRRRPEPAILIGHSLGSLLITHYAARFGSAGISGALLVAPADIENHDGGRRELRSFAPIPMLPLPFPADAVVSADDPYAALERSRELALSWGANLIEIGARGHINVEAGCGDWPEGQALLARLISRVSGNDG